MAAAGDRPLQYRLDLCTLWGPVVDSCCLRLAVAGLIAAWGATRGARRGRCDAGDPLPHAALYRVLLPTRGERALVELDVWALGAGRVQHRIFRGNPARRVGPPAP